MSEDANTLISAKIEWLPTGDSEFPYKATYNGRALLLRLNDFPEENLYTLVLEGEEKLHLDDFPDKWVRR